MSKYLMEIPASFSVSRSHIEKVGCAGLDSAWSRDTRNSEGGAGEIMKAVPVKKGEKRPAGRQFAGKFRRLFMQSGNSWNRNF